MAEQNIHAYCDGPMTGLYVDEVDWIQLFMTTNSYFTIPGCGSDGLNPDPNHIPSLRRSFAKSFGGYIPLEMARQQGMTFAQAGIYTSVGYCTRSEQRSVSATTRVTAAMHADYMKVGRELSALL